jgi:hypothetical protein
MNSTGHLRLDSSSCMTTPPRRKRLSKKFDYYIEAQGCDFKGLAFPGRISNYRPGQTAVAS